LEPLAINKSSPPGGSYAFCYGNSGGTIQLAGLPEGSRRIYSRGVLPRRRSSGRFAPPASCV